MLWQQNRKWVMGVVLASALSAPTAWGQFTLVLDVEPAGAGVAVSNPNDTAIAEGEFVTVTATALDGFQFVGWEGDIIASESTMTFEMVDDTQLTAVFEADPGEQFTLTAFVDPSGAGTIVRDPADFTYSAGVEVTLTAFANEGFVFTGWSGDLPEGADATSETLTVTVSADADIEATFAAASTLQSDGSDTGNGVGAAACGSMGASGLGMIFALMLSMKLGRSRR